MCKNLSETPFAVHYRYVQRRKLSNFSLVARLITKSEIKNSRGPQIAECGKVGDAPKKDSKTQTHQKKNASVTNIHSRTSLT